MMSKDYVKETEVLRKGNISKEKQSKRLPFYYQYVLCNVIVGVIK